ncbi:hypothetical protein N0V95_005384 [Ascochyta clinopodiicola]|nr:hypothetical protein N0V95_005384 [Ascochyta clinopodiicola]
MVGAFEAGFFPTAVTYLSTFYCRYDLAVRIALFYGQYAIAGAFSGTIGRRKYVNRSKDPLTTSAAYGVFHINGTALHNWQYLFIIEGGLTILLGIAAWFWLPHGPESAWFLSTDDRQFATERILQDYATHVVQNCPGDTAKKQRLSKRDVKETVTDWKLWYILLFNICAKPGKRSLVLGVNGFGNLAGVIGGQLYKHKYAPGFRTPFYVTLGFVATALVGYISYRYALQAVNKRRSNVLTNKDMAQIEAEQTDDTRYADRKWTFTYGL